MGVAARPRTEQWRPKVWHDRVMLPTLNDGSSTLRPWRAEDAEDLRREVQDPETVRWMAIELLYTLEDARGFISGTARAWEEREAAHFVIAGRDGRLIGYLGVLSVEKAMRVVEIGYWVAARERGRGVATSALQLALHWVTEAIAPERIELGLLSGNEASRAVAEKTGFEFDRSEPSGKQLDGEPVEEWIFVFRS